jgi:hypothetical protein
LKSSAQNYVATRLVQRCRKKLISDSQPKPEKVRDINSGKNDKNASRRAQWAPRRLAAIVAGDIAAGYRRLMGYDEEGTQVRMKRIQRDLIEPSITQHYGRLVKNPWRRLHRDF